MTSRAHAAALGRERELFESLLGMPIDGLVVIGGYAVSARSIARYSHDIDIVLDSTAVEGTRSFLEARRFKKTRSREGFDQNYGGSWERWERPDGGATVDLLPASVQDRSFRVPMPYERAARGAQLMALRGLEESPLRLPVASVEVLIALKIQPLRARDVGDIACLALSGYSQGALRRLVAPLAAARSTLYRERVAALRTALVTDPEAALQLLGSRIPGPRSGRERGVRAARALVEDLDKWGEERQGQGDRR